MYNERDSQSLIKLTAIKINEWINQANETREK